MFDPIYIFKKKRKTPYYTEDEIEELRKNRGTSDTDDGVKKQLIHISKETEEECGLREAR